MRSNKALESKKDRHFLAGKMGILIDGKIEQMGMLKEVLDRSKSDFIKRLLRLFS